jgi:hypothetical protein
MINFCNNGVQLRVHLACAEYSADAIHTYRFAFGFNFPYYPE